ncbi:MAG: formate--phosphoribosylaminoimidazolecarboxamide ligase [Parcubacteria group bacterium]|nr:formate--phosphoribosylaminoimidazolecarboxamide ligase [Parcubacteria group bacterium]
MDLPIIATLGSHSALQILKGAKDEGFRTLLLAERGRVKFYRSYQFIDDIQTIEHPRELLAKAEELVTRNVILIPHGSFVAYVGGEKNRDIHVPYFGNKAVLDWEEDRTKQAALLHAAGILTPRHFAADERISFPVIVKPHGARGGKGYVVARTPDELDRTRKRLQGEPYVVQEYIIGVPVYIHYFYSPIRERIEIFGFDRRYETNVDGLSRAVGGKIKGNTDPSFVVVGNFPMTIRESLLPEVEAAGEAIVTASRSLIDSRGLFGPFCLETIVSEDLKFYAIEISCRIVAGTNPYITGSPYSALLFEEPMSTGRRIAREIKEAIAQGRLSTVLS